LALLHETDTSTEGIIYRQHYKKFGVRLDSVASHRWIGVDFVWMTPRTRFWAVAALLALLGTPGLSCFVPQQLLSASENECCRQMGSQCGSKEMSSPQSCCKSPTQQSAQLYIASGEHFQIAPAGIIAAFLPVAPASILLAAGSALAIPQFHSPPLSFSEANSVLRI
jgi:hypothetical protein